MARPSLIACVSLVFLSLLALTATAAHFVRVAPGGRYLELDGKPFVVQGFNYYPSVWLAMADEHGGNRSRLERDLQELQRMGATTIRIMAGSLGPDGSPYRWFPALFPKPHESSEAVFEGFDYLLLALKRNGLKVIISLSDFWQASGGFGQYVEWATQRAIPYPPSFPGFNGSWPVYIDYARRFYNDTKIRSRCQRAFRRDIATVVSRNNTITRMPYNRDPTILAWELVNEPQAPPFWFIHKTARFIKKLDKRHLVTTGLEGKESDNCALFDLVHSSRYVDFATVHCWVENWGVYRSYNMSSANLQGAIAFAKSFIHNHSRCAGETFKKPVLLEEFGLARDGDRAMPWNTPSPQNRFSPLAPTTHRDLYFESVCNATADLMNEGYLTGLMVWAWSGEGRPSDPGPRRLGDPPHETPGWYSVFNSDRDTINLLTKCFWKLREESMKAHGDASVGARSKPLPHMPLWQGRA